MSEISIIKALNESTDYDYIGLAPYREFSPAMFGAQLGGKLSPLFVVQLLDAFPSDSEMFNTPDGGHIEYRIESVKGNIGTLEIDCPKWKSVTVRLTSGSDFRVLVSNAKSFTEAYNAINLEDIKACLIDNYWSFGTSQPEVDASQSYSGFFTEDDVNKELKAKSGAMSWVSESYLDKINKETNLQKKANLISYAPAHIDPQKIGDYIAENTGTYVKRVDDKSTKFGSDITLTFEAFHLVYDLHVTSRFYRDRGKSTHTFVAEVLVNGERKGRCADKNLKKVMDSVMPNIKDLAGGDVEGMVVEPETNPLTDSEFIETWVDRDYAESIRKAVNWSTKDKRLKDATLHLDVSKVVSSISHILGIKPFSVDVNTGIFQTIEFQLVVEDSDDVDTVGAVRFTSYPGKRKFTVEIGANPYTVYQGLSDTFYSKSFESIEGALNDIRTNKGEILKQLDVSEGDVEDSIVDGGMTKREMYDESYIKNIFNKAFSSTKYDLDWKSSFSAGRVWFSVYRDGIFCTNVSMWGFFSDDTDTLNVELEGHVYSNNKLKTVQEIADDLIAHIDVFDKLFKDKQGRVKVQEIGDLLVPKAVPKVIKYFKDNYGINVKAVGGDGAGRTSVLSGTEGVINFALCGPRGGVIKSSGEYEDLNLIYTVDGGFYLNHHPRTGGEVKTSVCSSIDDALRGIDAKVWFEAILKQLGVSGDYKGPDNKGGNRMGSNVVSKEQFIRDIENALGNEFKVSWIIVNKIRKPDEPLDFKPKDTLDFDAGWVHANAVLSSSTGEEVAHAYLDFKSKDSIKDNSFEIKSEITGDVVRNFDYISSYEGLLRDLAGEKDYIVSTLLGRPLPATGEYDFMASKDEIADAVVSTLGSDFTLEGVKSSVSGVNDFSVTMTFGYKGNRAVMGAKYTEIRQESARGGFASTRSLFFSDVDDEGLYGSHDIGGFYTIEDISDMEDMKRGVRGGRQEISEACDEILDERVTSGDKRFDFPYSEQGIMNALKEGLGAGFDVHGLKSEIKDPDKIPACHTTALISYFGNYVAEFELRQVREEYPEGVYNDTVDSWFYPFDKDGELERIESLDPKDIRDLEIGIRGFRDELITYIKEDLGIDGPSEDSISLPSAFVPYMDNYAIEEFNSSDPDDQEDMVDRVATRLSGSKMATKLGSVLGCNVKCVDQDEHGGDSVYLFELTSKSQLIGTLKIVGNADNPAVYAILCDKDWVDLEETDYASDPEKLFSMIASKKAIWSNAAGFSAFSNSDPAGIEFPSEEKIKAQGPYAQTVQTFVRKHLEELNGNELFTTFFIDTAQEYKKFGITIPAVCLVCTDRRKTKATLKKEELVKKFDKSKTLKRYSDWKKDRIPKQGFDGEVWYTIYVSAKAANEDGVKALREETAGMTYLGYLNEEGSAVIAPKAGDVFTRGNREMLVEEVDGNKVILENGTIYEDAMFEETTDLDYVANLGSTVGGMVVVGSYKGKRVFSDSNDNLFIRR